MSVRGLSEEVGLVLSIAACPPSQQKLDRFVRCFQVAFAPVLSSQSLLVIIAV